MAPPAPAAMISSLRMTLAIVAALAGGAVAFALGNWQLRRAAEKVAIEQTWDAARNAAPVEVRGAPELAAVAAQLPRRVRVRGWFEYEHTIWLDNRPLDGRAGFLVVTPLRVDGAEARILVNRGWAPRDPVQRTHLPPIGRPEGLVEIEGIAVQGVPRVLQFTDADVGPIRQNVDVDESRNELGASIAGFVLQQTSPLDDSLDRRWIPPATGVDRHRGYAFQWFALAALFGVITMGLLWRAISGRRTGEGGA